ncbi:MAG TPA: IclR family transcriptional regulator [Rhizomicrobium sp.]|nr:IclR family transcriptional regulator [Rhizomicrobium sp.]
MSDKTFPSITDENDPDGLEESADGRRRYRAPALEKGLDILELMAREGTPMTPSQIATRLDRSVSELFRMILVLELRGYIEQSSEGQGYELTNKPFTLGMGRARVRVLLEIALPIMRDLSREIDQACHLGMASGDQMVVVARIENPGYLGFSVRPGYRRALVEATSGLVLFAFQHEAVRKEWIGRFESGTGKARLDGFLRQAEVVRTRGFAQAGSDFVQGVTDLSAPIMASDGCIAALTVPFVQRTSLPRNMVEAIDLVCTSAQRISQLLVGNG